MRDFSIFEIPLPIGIALHANKGREGAEEQLPKSNLNVFVAIFG